MAALRAVTSRGEVVLARLNEDAIGGGSLRGCASLLSCCATTDALVRFLQRWTRLAAWSIWCLRTANPPQAGSSHGLRRHRWRVFRVQARPGAPGARRAGDGGGARGGPAAAR